MNRESKRRREKSDFRLKASSCFWCFFVRLTTAIFIFRASKCICLVLNKQKENIECKNGKFAKLFVMLGEAFKEGEFLKQFQSAFVSKLVIQATIIVNYFNTHHNICFMFLHLYDTKLQQSLLYIQSKQMTITAIHRNSCLTFTIVSLILSLNQNCVVFKFKCIEILRLVHDFVKA